MWVVILIGLIAEGMAIGFALSEDGLLLYSWILSLIATVIIEFALLGSQYSVSFWLLLFILWAIPNISIAVKWHLEKRTKEKARRREEQRQKEALRVQAQQRQEDENRIEAHMSGIRTGKKYRAFKESFAENLPMISRIEVQNGSVRVYLPRSGNLFIPDYQQGRMVLNSTCGYIEHSYFGRAADEREWTVFESEALARIIDEEVNATGLFTMNYSDNGYRRYSRNAPTEPVFAKTPY